MNHTLILPQQAFIFHPTDSHLYWSNSTFCPTTNKKTNYVIKLYQDKPFNEALIIDQCIFQKLQNCEELTIYINNHQTTHINLDLNHQSLPFHQFLKKITIISSGPVNFFGQQVERLHTFCPLQELNISCSRIYLNVSYGFYFLKKIKITTTQQAMYLDQKEDDFAWSLPFSNNPNFHQVNNNKSNQICLQYLPTLQEVDLSTIPEFLFDLDDDNSSQQVNYCKQTSPFTFSHFNCVKVNPLCNLKLNPNLHFMIPGAYNLPLDYLLSMVSDYDEFTPESNIPFQPALLVTLKKILKKSNWPKDVVKIPLYKFILKFCDFLQLQTIKTIKAYSSSIDKQLAKSLFFNPKK